MMMQSTCMSTKNIMAKVFDTKLHKFIGYSNRPALTIALLFGFSLTAFLTRLTGVFRPGQRPSIQLEKGSFQEKCTFVIACGTGDINTIIEMRALIVSAILLSSCPLHFILVADRSSAGMARRFFREEINTSHIPISVDIWTIPITGIERWARNLGMGLHKGLEKKGPWLLAKLYIPLMLREYSRVIVLDSDMIFLEDPAVLWSNFYDGKPWTFKLPLKDLTTASRICSCVILIKVQNVIRENIYPHKVKRALLKNGQSWFNSNLGIYLPKHADQGVYYALRMTYPYLFESLDRRYNVDHCHDYYGVFDNNINIRNRQAVSLLHRNCGSSTPLHINHAEPFFSFFKLYQTNWLKNDLNERSFKTQITSHVLNYVPLNQHF